MPATADQDSERARRPAVTARVIAFAVDRDGLKVALVTRDGEPALPSGELRGEESLTDCAERIARGALGAAPDYLEQLYTFRDPGSGGEVIVAYYAMLSAVMRATVERAGLARFEHVDAAPALPGIERAMLDYATVRLRAKLSYSNVAFYFLEREFTLSELQDVYESTLGRALDKRNFRRRIQAAGIVEPVGARRSGANYRPAAVYRFAGGDPATGALTPDETEWSA